MSSMPHSYRRALGLSTKYSTRMEWEFRLTPGSLRNVPQVLLTGDQDPRHPRPVDEKTARFVGAEHIYLADVGIRGHGHMMMIEKDNEKIARLITDWLSKKSL